MSLHEQDIHKLLRDVERFLQQDRELYGELFLMTPPSSNKPPKPPAPAGEPLEADLFGDVTPASHKGKAARAPAPVTVRFPDEPWVQAADLVQLDGMINTCMKCGLGQTRKNFVFGVGNPNAGLVLIGEAPGADEDEQGEPFVGRAGQLLNKILEAIQFRREDVYICNILKCRPPNNREPEAAEVELCEPYLWKQLELIKPKIILCLGRVAAQALLKTNYSLTALRSRLHDHRGTTVMVTYHPAALLRNPHWKRHVWEDVQKLRKMYDEMAKG
jgi:uracil-DNA glycosylase family 4